LAIRRSVERPYTARCSAVQKGIHDLVASFLANFAPSQYTRYFTVQSRTFTIMLLNRDYTGYMASEVIKKLLEDNQIEIKEKDQETIITRLRLRMMEEITIEDKVNDEVRNILTQYQDEMRRTGISYQEMFKKVKGQIARDRKLILR
jgi:hypothetical protein